MVAHEKRNSAQLFCAVPTRNDLALSSLLFPAQPTQKLEYPSNVHKGHLRICGIIEHSLLTDAVLTAGIFIRSRFPVDKEGERRYNPINL